MSTKRSEDRALARVRQLAKPRPGDAGDSVAHGFDAPLAAFVKASDPRPKPQVGVVDEAVSLAIGGDVVRPYSEKNMAMGCGDVSSWPDPTETLTPEEHQAQADRALVAKNADHAEKRGLTAAEEKLWREAAALLTDLAVLFARLRDECWEPRERRREELRHHGELANVLNGSEEAEEAFQGAWVAPIRPLPVTFAHFLAFCAEATSDPRGRGYREGVVFDEGRRIVDLLPELKERPAQLLRTEKWQTAELPFGA